jgi:hypothetical protein
MTLMMFRSFRIQSTLMLTIRTSILPWNFRS